jgi:hypothetical protein
MSQEFEDWLAQLASEEQASVYVPAEEDVPPAEMPARWRAWHEQIFEEWGPLPLQDVVDLREIEGDRLMALQLETVRGMIPSIVADGHAVGMALDVVARLNDWGALEVLASPEPGGRYYWASNGGLSWALENDVELLVWLADEVQEATMERDQVNVFVWPVCAVHQLGGHAGVVAGAAVWSCNGAGGHVLAPIGKLSRARRRTVDRHAVKPTKPQRSG